MGQIVPATVMTCTLAVDARVLDATNAAELLGHIKTFVEDPVRMLA
jgi:pyruvate/2-oxoglutarate dehydrogenase complex dihydrolipoamide acyltransferase (E2) component